MTDQEIIVKIIEDGLSRIKKWSESTSEKREIIISQIAKAINSSAKTVKNARSSGDQVLGRDKSTLLRIYARERKVIK